MSAAMFGAPAGISQAITDEGTIAQTEYTRGRTAQLPADLAYKQAQTEQLRAQTGAIPSEIELRRAQASKAPAEILDLLARAGENMVEAGQKNFALQEAKRLQEAVQKAAAEGKFAVDADGKPMSVSKSITAMGQVAMGAGNLAAAEKAFNQANLAWGHETSAERLVFDKKKDEQKLDLDVFERVGFYTPWIQDQAGLDNLNKEIFNLTGKMPPWGHLKYSPELVDKIGRDSIKYKDRVLLEMRQDAADALQRQREITNANAALGRQLEERRIEEAKIRAENNAKKGSISAAPQSEIDGVIQLALENMPDLKGVKNKAALSTFASSVANDARQLRLKNPGFTPEQAQYKAFMDRKEELEISGRWDKELKYNSSRIGTRETPIPFTPDLKPAEGRYYNKGGKIGQWAKKPDGTFGMKLVE